MARICEICEKGYKKGNAVKRGTGRRVTGRSTRRQQPNLRSVKLDLNNDGNAKRMRICASCLKRLKKDDKIQTGAPDNQDQE